MTTSSHHRRHVGSSRRASRAHDGKHRFTPSARKDALHRARAESLPTRVLVAEDDDDMRRLLVRALRDEGFEVVEARNGWELLDYVGRETLDERDEQPPDLIVSDVRMHGVTGLEFLAGLRATDRVTPVILITAFGDAALHDEARRLGALAVLDKPFDLRDLRRLARTTVLS